jgi:hypothetical protein
MDTWPGRGWGLGPQYIRRLHVIEEYIPICSSAIYSYIPRYREI